MSAESMNFSLLLISLVLSLFIVLLCLVTAWLYFDLSSRVTALMNRDPLGGMKGMAGRIGKDMNPFPAPSRWQIRTADPARNPKDIVSGVGSIAEKYRLDSLTIAMPDGLVVASAGTRDPDYDAAHFSSLFTGGSSLAECDVWLFPLAYQGIPLVGIARSSTAAYLEEQGQIAEEIELVLMQGL